MAQHSMITCTPGVQGGYPCIKGTRTPVRAIVECYEMYDGDIDEILLDFSHLNREQVRAALDYYQDCPELVDADIKRQWDATLKLLTLDVSKIV